VTSKHELAFIIQRIFLSMENNKHADTLMPDEQILYGEKA